MGCFFFHSLVVISLQLWLRNKKTLNLNHILKYIVVAYNKDYEKGNMKCKKNTKQKTYGANELS